MKHFLTGSISLIIGLILGVGGYYLYLQRQSDKLEKGITIETIEGKAGSIKHEKIKNYPNRIEFTTISKKPGIIKTIIKKSAFCPKIKKNSLSFVVCGGLQNSQPVLSYGIEYRRTFLSKFHILAGVKIGTSSYLNYGFEVFTGAGINF